MGKIYYKQVLSNIITFFFVNTVTRNVEGMFREFKDKNTISIMRNIDTTLWEDIDNNDLAKALLDASTPIKQEEYEAAEFVMLAMIGSDYWFLSEDKYEEPKIEENVEVVAETVYC